MNIEINPNKIRTWMLSIISVLAILHIGQLCLYFYYNDPDVFDFIELVDFDFEGNLPSVYSSLALLSCAIQLWLISIFKTNEGKQFKKHWQFLALIFLFLSLDEAIGIHEELGDYFETLALFDAEGFLYFAWVVPYGILVLLLLFSYLKFILHLPAVTKIRFIIAGVMFVSGAIGFEIISAQEADANGTDTILYSLLYTIEELLEMVAVVIFCHALLCYQALQYKTIQLTLSER